MKEKFLTPLEMERNRERLISSKNEVFFTSLKHTPFSERLEEAMTLIDKKGIKAFNKFGDKKK